jgi:hypothetical protein
MSGDTNRLVFGRVIVIEVVDADGRLHPEQPWAFLGFAPEELCLAVDIDLGMLQARDKPRWVAGSRRNVVMTRS